jgi:hypothetical protein
MIKWKDVVDPLTELCFEDEETASAVFGMLVRGMEDVQNQTPILIQLLERSTRKSMHFVSAVLSTIFEITKRFRTLFPKSDVVKQIGVESFAFY